MSRYRNTSVKREKSNSSFRKSATRLLIQSSWTGSTNAPKALRQALRCSRWTTSRTSSATRATIKAIGIRSSSRSWTSSGPACRIRQRRGLKARVNSCCLLLASWVVTIGRMQVCRDGIAIRDRHFSWSNKILNYQNCLHHESKSMRSLSDSSAKPNYFKNWNKFP